MIRELHAEYVKHGASVITTNSFSANRFRLTQHNLQDKTIELNQKAGEIARSAIGDQGYVAGSVGPLGVRIEPWGPTSLRSSGCVL